MRTPQLTEQYGHVDRVSVARAILSSLSCATAGVRSNPRREKAAPPVSAPLRKVLRESSMVSSSRFDHNTKNGLAEPLIDELASVPLDLWAQEHGYAKLHPNLLGI